MLPDIPYSDTPDSTDTNDSAGLAESFRSSVQSSYASRHDSASATITGVNSSYFNATVNRLQVIDNTVEEIKYEGLPATVEEKTDPNAEEDNFVKIFRKKEHYRNASNINSGYKWLLNMIGRNDDTANMLDLTKYLLYKCTDKSYGTNSVDFSIFSPDMIKEIGKGSIDADSPEAKLWSALKEAGYSDVSAASVLGNIYVESEVNPSLIDNKELSSNRDDEEPDINSPASFIGINRWSKNRKKKLIKFAESRGKEWSDIDIQIEYLLAEIAEEPGGADGYATNFAIKSGSLQAISRDAWLEEENVEEATSKFMLWYEIPDSKKDGGKEALRRAKAKEFMIKFKKSPNTSAGNNGSGSAEDIIAACEELTQHYLDMNAIYSVQGGELIYGNIEACYDSQYICCATYVSLALLRSGALTAEQINAYNYHYTGPGGIPDMLQAAGWTKVSASEMQPGDVINDYCEHVLVYAGNDTYWDQNSCVTYRGMASSAPTRGPITSYTARSGDLQVWRAPSNNTSS